MRHKSKGVYKKLRPTRIRDYEMGDTEYRNVSERWDYEHTDAHGYPQKVYEASYFDDSDDKKANAYNAYGIFWKDGYFKQKSVRSTGYGRTVYEDTYEEDVVMSYDMLWERDLKKILNEGETIRVPLLSGEKKGAVIRLGLVKSKLVETDDFVAVGKFLFKPGSDNKILTGYLRSNNEDNTDLVIPDSTEIIADEAFKDLHSIKSVTIPNSVKSIGVRAFEDCWNIIHLDLGLGVECIGDFAFMNCGIETLIVPDSVKEIGEGAFARCTKLKSATLPQHLTTLRHTFQYCYRLASVNIPSCVEIMYSTFEGCSLEEIEIPDSVKILSEAFRGCSKLKSVKIPAGLKAINNYEFQGCVSLTSVVIPDSVERIGRSAFYKCQSLKTVTIPALVKNIDNGAFEGCTSLCEVNFLGQIQFLGEDAFKDCPAKIVLPTKQVFSNLPKRLDGYFKHNQCLINVELPPSVKEIGFDAFRGCKNLVSVKLPDSVTVVDQCAFEGCENLRDIILPESMKKIGRCAFSGCRSLTNIRIPKSVREIASNAFSNSGITQVELHDTLQVYDYAFNNCKELTQIVIPSTDYTKAFHGCSKIKQVYFSKPLTKIREFAFNGFSAMTEFEIPDTVKEIGSEAFQETQITSLIIPESVRKIEFNAFKDSSITDVKWPVSLKTITGFFGNKVLKEISIPSTVNAIGNNAFGCCRNLMSVHIPNGVTSIGDAAFNGCSSLVAIELPDSLTEIGERAFWYCNNLCYINIPKGVKKIPGFIGCENLKTVKMSRELYENFSKCFSKGTEFLFYDDILN